MLISLILESISFQMDLAVYHDQDVSIVYGIRQLDAYQ
jgi:hypothetical protein